MNKRIILLLLTLLASKIYCMEPVKMSPEERAELLNRQSYELIRRPEGFLAKLPADLQKELLQYRSSYIKKLDDEYNKLIQQPNKIVQEDLHFPSYEVFKDLIEDKGLTLDDFIHWSVNSRTLFNVLIWHWPIPWEILKLFIEKHAGHHWDEYANKLNQNLNYYAHFLYRDYKYKLDDKKIAGSINTMEKHLDLLQTMIHENLGTKNYIKKLYQDLLEKYPELQPTARRLEQEREQKSWEMVPELTAEEKEEAIKREIEEFHIF